MSRLTFGSEGSFYRLQSNWTYFLPYFSAEYTQKYLYKKYQNLQLADAEKKSYENCYKFIYYLEHGKIYYDQAKRAPIVIQPILIFYGFTHLLKASILTVDPNYPDSTTVLAHGVTSRKRKKQQYQFLLDEVKIQKTGLFPLIAQKMFHMKHLEGEKFVMEKLLQSIPELSYLFEHIHSPKNFLKVEQTNRNQLVLPEKLLDIFSMTKKRFLDYMNTTYSFLDLKENFLLDISNNLLIKDSPIRFNNIDKQYYFFLKRQDTILPELLAHYLLLYNLSMISRYETEWWSELLKTTPTIDYPLILSFCDTAIEKELLMIARFLCI